MTIKKREKVLITLDGSNRSLQTATYASRLKALQQMDIKLLHIFDKIPENFWDVDISRQVVGSIAGVRAWENQRKKKMTEYMTEAQQILLHAGFSLNNLNVDMQYRNKGIARDIIKEAQKGYKMIITRRRGMGAIRSLIVGSVTTKLLDTLNNTPILLAGQHPPGHKFLVAVDGSPTTSRIMEFIAEILDGYGYQVGLVHVVRSGANVFTGDMPMPLFNPESFMKDALKKSANILEQARDKLLDVGVKKKHIKIRTITGVASRAVALTEEAKKGGYGTLVMGRKGLSSVGEFAMGRVTKKVIYMARKHSVWIIP